MSAAPTLENQETPINMKITKDLQMKYKEILAKHLDERKIKEEKVYSWMDNVLIDAKEYFIKKYPEYDIFLYVYICHKDVYFYANSYSISLTNIDWVSSATLSTDDLYSTIYFFFFKHYNLNYSLDNYESEIIKKGNDILIKHLEERKYNYNKLSEYNTNINNEHCDFILKKENKCRCFFLTQTFQNPIKNKFYYKYLTHGKDIYSKIIQTYSNDSLVSFHYVFFFK